LAVFKSLIGNDITQTTSVLNQLVDIVREDISGSNSRKSYEVFVTSSVGPGVTSSLYQTIFDQDFSLQTANSLFDMTFGFRPALDFLNTTTSDPKVYLGGSGLQKKRYTETSLMLREKQDIYRQFAATLLGDGNKEFHAPFDSDADSSKIDYAIFLSFHRLFVRDGIKRETFAMRLKFNIGDSKVGTTFQDNLFQIQGTEERIYTDFGSTTFQPTNAAGNVGNIVFANDTTQNVGLIFYDHGTVVLNAAKVFNTNTNQVGHGVISAMTNTTSNASTANSVYGTAGVIPAGKSLFGPEAESGGALQFAATSNTQGGSIFPYFFTSASIDDICNHICSTRFGNDSGTAITFQNRTEINSQLYFIRAMPDEFNYSTNPTYVDNNGNIQVIKDDSRPFSFITTVGLYGNSDELLAVAKTSRPIEKNDEKDLTIRVRLDF